MGHLIVHIIGTDNASGFWYLFWSGFFSALSILAAPVVLYRKHQCHQPWCLRIGRFPATGTPFTLCHQHHPDMDGPVTVQQIAEAHAAATQKETTE